jgi:hypothetical protein
MKRSIVDSMLSLLFGRLVGGEYRNNVLLCAATAKGRLAVLILWRGGATEKVEIWRNKGRMAVP